MAVFLTEVSARHAILRKDKRVKSDKRRIGTYNGKLTGSGTKAIPVEVGDEGLNILREDSQEEKMVDLSDIPMAIDEVGGDKPSQASDSDEEELFISDCSEDSETLDKPRSKNTIRKPSSIGEEKDDKKKMALNTTYDGFSIYGRILCMVVKRRGGTKGKAPAGGSGQAMMEEWITSTQLGEGRMMDE